MDLGGIALTLFNDHDLLQKFLYSGALRFLVFLCSGGWSGGAMVLCKLPVPGRPTYLE